MAAVQRLVPDGTEDCFKQADLPGLLLPSCCLDTGSRGQTVSIHRVHVQVSEYFITLTVS